MKNRKNDKSDEVMMKIEMREATSKEEWDKFVTSFEEANFLQSWDFYEFHRARGKKVVRRVFEREKKIVAVYAGVVETAKRGWHLAVAGGPIMDFEDEDLRTRVFADMREVARREKCVFVRVRPQIEFSEENLGFFCAGGFRAAPMYLSVEHAGILDLNLSEEEILAGMRTRLRRALRKADKNGITVDKSTEVCDIDKFYEIQLETAKRHDFVYFSKDFLKKQFAALAPNGEAVLYTAKHEGKILAQNFMIFYGNEASYHYGVSSELGTKLSGAPVLHMEAMRDARKRGIKRYNFWGIVPENATSHRFYGVSVFKRGFGVKEYFYVPAQDLVICPVKYAVNWLIETVRRYLRRV